MAPPRNKPYYNAHGGCRMKNPKIKEQILSWDKGRRVGIPPLLAYPICWQKGSLRQQVRSTEGGLLTDRNVWYCREVTYQASRDRQQGVTKNGNEYSSQKTARVQVQTAARQKRGSSAATTAEGANLSTIGVP